MQILLYAPLRKELAEVHRSLLSQCTAGTLVCSRRVISMLAYGRRHCHVRNRDLLKCAAVLPFGPEPLKALTVSKIVLTGFLTYWSFTQALCPDRLARKPYRSPTDSICNFPLIICSTESVSTSIQDAACWSISQHSPPPTPLFTILPSLPRAKLPQG